MLIKEGLYFFFQKITENSYLKILFFFFGCAVLFWGFFLKKPILYFFGVFFPCFLLSEKIMEELISLLTKKETWEFNVELVFFLFFLVIGTILYMFHKILYYICFIIGLLGIFSILFLFDAKNLVYYLTLIICSFVLFLLLKHFENFFSAFLITTTAVLGTFLIDDSLFYFFKQKSFFIFLKQHYFAFVLFLVGFVFQFNNLCFEKQKKTIYEDKTKTNSFLKTTETIV